VTRRAQQRQQPMHGRWLRLLMAVQKTRRRDHPAQVVVVAWRGVLLRAWMCAPMTQGTWWSQRETSMMCVRRAMLKEEVELCATSGFLWTWLHGVCVTTYVLHNNDCVMCVLILLWVSVCITP
jgi:hypothetical protein